MSATARKMPAAPVKAASAPAKAAAPKAKPVTSPAPKAPVPAARKKPATPPAQAAAKSAKLPKAPKAPKAPKVEKPAKPKPALVRDSFTMPEEDFKRIATLKARALDQQRPAKKSELLRAGLQVLEGLTAAALVEVLNRLVTLKPGRPKKHR